MQLGTKPRNPLSWFLALATVAVLSGGCGTSQEPTAKTEPPATDSESQQKPDTSSTPPAAAPLEEPPQEIPSEPAETTPHQPDETSSDSSVEMESSDEESQPDSDLELMPAETQPPTTSNTSDSGVSETTITESVHPTAEPTSLPVPVAMPTVAMSDAHANTCLINIGDQFPQVVLNDPLDQPHELASLLGEELTVVLLWNSQSPYAIAQLRDLQTDVLRRFDNAKVAVVGINVGDSADKVRDITAGANVGYAQLLDNEGSLYHQLATRCIPRIYLLDSQGKVIWLDLEYTVSTARHLSQGIAYQLAN